MILQTPGKLMLFHNCQRIIDTRPCTISDYQFMQSVINFDQSRAVVLLFLGFCYLELLLDLIFAAIVLAEVLGQYICFGWLGIWLNSLIHSITRLDKGAQILEHRIKLLVSYPHQLKTPF
jgi:hypothetical protein